MRFHGSYRNGTPSELAAEFIGTAGTGRLNLKTEEFTDPFILSTDNVMAVHFAHGGAQGECGAVNILYSSPEGIRVLHGNHVYGGLDCDDLIQQLPVLRVFADTVPALTGSKLPEGWKYMYMGALNYFVVRQQVCDETEAFIEYLMNNDGQSWQIFDAVAWLYGADYSTEPRQFK